VAAASAAKEVPIYDVETGKRLASCQGQPGVYTLSFHPNGRQLATGGFDGRVRIYAVESGEMLKAFIPVPIEKKLLSSN
jgi:WD40 repeat protein